MKSIAWVAGLLGLAVSVTSPAAAQDKPVSYTKDIAPIFKAACEKCHNDKKTKGKLNMTTYTLLKKGGKEGQPWVDGDPEKSMIVKMISGKEPEMPEEGDPLKPEQIALISKWIKEGAKDDTPK
jgi:mono/diheme cytochrome c family protein